MLIMYGAGCFIYRGLFHAQGKTAFLPAQNGAWQIIH